MIEMLNVAFVVVSLFTAIVLGALLVDLWKYFKDGK